MENLDKVIADARAALDKRPTILDTLWVTAIIMIVATPLIYFTVTLAKKIAMWWPL